MPNPYATQEDPALLWLEQVNFVAVYIGAVAYGVTIAVVATCAYYLVQYRNNHSWKWLIYVAILFVLSSLNITLNMRFSQEAYINNKNYPGGSLAYLLEQQAVTTNTIGNAESVALSLVADALLVGFLVLSETCRILMHWHVRQIYRCYKVYGKWWVLPIPILAWLAVGALGVLFTLQAAQPQSSLWATTTVNFSLPYFGIITALNILLNILMVARLLDMRRQMMKALGAQHGRIYSNISWILIESATPYGIISLIFVILYGSHKAIANAFIPLFSQMQCIVPCLIILRVARGRAWTSRTVTEQVSRVRFKTGSSKSNGSTTARNGESGKDGSEEVLSMIAFEPGKKDVSESIGLDSQLRV